MSFLPDYYVYTDGACSKNGYAGACAGIGVYFGPNDPRNVSKKVIGKQTNNTAELSAIIFAYKEIENDILYGKNVTIVTDSEYSLKCLKSYGEKCEKKNWELEMPNKELVKYAYELFKNKPNVEFMHIRSHTGRKDVHSIGNENADRLANLAIGVDTENPSPNAKPKKIYLKVPYERKDEAKSLGAKWEFSKKKWYVEEANMNKDKLVELFGL
jgi:ribonuclease HI